MKPRIITVPSLRLGGSQQPHPLLVVLRRGFNPIPRPFPSPGEGMQPLASARSVTKVSATHQRVVKESRGDPLRNKVAIVCAGFARVCSNFVIWKCEYLRRSLKTELLSHYRHHQLPCATIVAVLAEIDALPCSQVQAAVGDGDGETHPTQC